MTSPLEAASDAPDVERSRLARLTTFIDRFGALGIVLIMGTLSYVAQPDVFLTTNNIANIFRQTAFLALLALGQFMVIVTAGIDLSVGSTLALAMMSTAVLSVAGVPWPLLILTPFLVGAAVGVINGVGLTWLHMPHPFIMTLGMLNIARGLTNLISGGVPISGLPAEVRWLGAGNVSVGGLQVPVSVGVVILSYLAVWVFLQHTRTGRHVYAIGETRKPPE
ncbi:MAG: ABC transporter permease [Candidatus Limnocylindrales bacterium]